MPGLEKVLEKIGAKKGKKPQEELTEEESCAQDGQAIMIVKLQHGGRGELRDEGDRCKCYRIWHFKYRLGVY